MASTLAFVGRFLFALLFLASGFQKLMTYEPSKGGGAVAHMVSDKLQTTFKSVHELTGVEVPLHKDHHQYLLLAAVALELVGGALFMFDFTVGAIFLLLFIAGVTPIVHDFWNVKDATAQQLEGAQFFKNVALAGALLFYLAKPVKVKLA